MMDDWTDRRSCVVIHHTLLLLLLFYFKNFLKQNKPGFNSIHFISFIPSPLNSYLDGWMTDINIINLGCFVVIVFVYYY